MGVHKALAQGLQHAKLGLQGLRNSQVTMWQCVAMQPAAMQQCSLPSTCSCSTTQLARITHFVLAAARRFHHAVWYQVLRAQQHH